MDVISLALAGPSPMKTLSQLLNICLVLALTIAGLLLLSPSGFFRVQLHPDEVWLYQLIAAVTLPGTLLAGGVWWILRGNLSTSLGRALFLLTTGLLCIAYGVSWLLRNNDGQIPPVTVEASLVQALPLVYGAFSFGLLLCARNEEPDRPRTSDGYLEPWYDLEVTSKDKQGP